ncbi:MAG TPA: alpha/beta hydrolase [Acidimicrobiales bacterium]|nr:alpha/beta hydrolase [Acidimicrobiales bacterium]
MDTATLEQHRRTLETDGGPVSCLDVGDGPVALFVHGVATNALLWRHALPALAEDRRCVAVDLPLHGRSPARPGQDLSLPGLARVLDDVRRSLGEAEVDLVANDTGGAVAQVLAAEHPETLRTLVLTDCDTHDNLPPEAFKPTVEMAERGELAPLGVDLMADVAAIRGVAFGTGYEDPTEPPDDVVRAFLGPLFDSLESARRFEELLVGLRAEDLLAAEAGLRRLEVPTLVVWGTDDAFFETKWAHWLEELVPGVTEVVELDGARLFFPDERAEEFVPLVRAHWRRHAPA